MKTQQWIMVLALAAAVACTQRPSNPIGLPGENQVGSDFGGDDLTQFDFNPNGTMDIGGGFEQAAETTQDALNTLENTPGVEPGLVEGTGLASDSLTRFAEAFGGLLEGSQPQQLGPVLNDIHAAKLFAWQVAQRLWQLGLVDLSHAFAEEAQKVEILRFFNPTAGKHFFTTSHPEGYNATSQLGFVLEGVAFRVYRNPRHDCVRPLFRCLKGDGAHFMSTREDCEGQTTEGRFGFVCPQRRPYAYPEIHRVFNGSTDYMATVNELEFETVLSRGWTDEGTLGFAPN